MSRSLPAVGGRTLEPGSAAETLLAAAAALGGGAALAGGLVLAIRRVAGGFPGGPPTLAWLALAGGLALIAAVDLARRLGGGVAGSIGARLGVVVGVAAVAVTPLHGFWAALVPTAVATLVAVVPPPRPMPRPMPRRARPPATRRVRRNRSVAVSIRPTVRSGRLQQWQERYTATDGSDCVRAKVVLSIVEGDRTAHAHLGFCPAFAATPAVQVTTDYDGVEATVSVAEVLPWGVRIECRLAEPAEEPIEIPVDLVAKLAG